MRRPLTALAALLTATALTLTGCSSSTPATSAPKGSATPGQSATQTDGTQESPSPTPTVPPVTMTPNVVSGAAKVPVDTVVSVAASGGNLSSVAVSYVDAKTKKQVPLAGGLSDDKASWTATELLEPGTLYTVAMKGTNPEGTASQTTSTFTTQALSRNEQIYPTLLPDDGSTVGVAMPIIMTFDLPVPDKAKAQKLISITTTPATPGAFNWISSHEVHWRPAKYWAPGTKVVVDAPLNGVNLGKSKSGTVMYGEYSRHAAFTIGSNVSGQINLKTHQMTVYNNGAVVRTIPITGGKPASQTRSGIKVIMAKRDHFTMRAESLGLNQGDSEYYQPVFVDYALQVTHTGEYLHSAPWSIYAQGRYNVSHGCVGMSIANSRWLYNYMKVGDPVVVTGSTRFMQLGNGYADWNVSWADWQKGSAA